MAAYISVVMAYHNRRMLTIRTLDSIKKSKAIRFIEVILVDDGSCKSESVKDLEDRYPFLTVIECAVSEKWSYNSCVPYNIGFATARGKIIVIQNPECYHTNDILSTIYHNYHDSKAYWVAACYSLTKDQTYHWDPLNVSKHNGPVLKNGGNGWYNHSVHRPVGYHFLSVIESGALRKLRGFHDLFHRAAGYDDNEFLHRVRQKLKVVFRDDLVVLHQWHYGPRIEPQCKPNFTKPLSHTFNEKLFKNITPHVKDTRWYFPNIPKIAHFAWIGPLPLLNMHSIVTFHRLNPDWEIRFYTMSTQKSDDEVKWNTGEQTLPMTGSSKMEELLKLSYVHQFPFPELIHSMHLHAAQKADILRWYLLSTVGGAWFDMDIYFVRPMSQLILDGCMVSGDAFSANTVVSFYGVNRYIGALMSGPRNPFYADVYEKALKNVTHGKYQSAGRDILVGTPLSEPSFHNLHAGNLPESAFYAFTGGDADLKELFEKGPPRATMYESLGIHWYNGARRSREFVKTWKPHVIHVPKTPFEYAMKVHQQWAEYVKITSAFNHL